LYAAKSIWCWAGSNPEGWATWYTTAADFFGGGRRSHTPAPAAADRVTSRRMTGPRTTR